MKLIRLFFLSVLLSLTIIACGGGGGSSDTGTSVSGDALDRAYSALNLFSSQTRDAGTGISKDSGTVLNSSSYGCTDAYSISLAELDSFVETETNYSLCGTQQGNNNPLCIYPASFGYRTNEQALSVSGAEQDVVKIKLTSGAVTATQTVYGNDFELEFDASDSSSSCNSDAEPTFSSSDIYGSYDARVVTINSQGVPVISEQGNLLCDSIGCSGLIDTGAITYNSLYSRWESSILYNSSTYEVVAVSSPSTNVAFFVACSSFDTFSQSDLYSCLYVAAEKN